MKSVKFFDATLRDGSHVMRHRFELSTIAKYCSKIDACGMDVVIVGHGNGLGASSIQVGLSKYSDIELLKTARENLSHTRLGAFMIPGFGTIDDDLIPAIDVGVDVFKIGCHCTESDTMRQHIEYLVSQGKEVYGVLMSSHMASNDVLVVESKKIESYGAKGVIFMDSAGAILPGKVRDLVRMVQDDTELEIGYHGHNNLGLAVGNALIALENGAKIVDGTLKGFGAGAGNCQLEVIVAILKSLDCCSSVNLYQMMDVADEVISHDLGYEKGLDGLTIISGISGVFSAFKEKVRDAARIYNLDPRDVFIELGRRNVVGGQEDMIIDVAMNLSQKRNLDDASSYMLESLL